MSGNTQTTQDINKTFYTGVVSLVQGILNPPNSPQTNWDCGVSYTFASITTVITGSPASFTITLEGTMDGSNWTTLATTTNTAGETVYSTGLIPFTNLRAHCTAVSGGTSPTVSVVAVAYQNPPQSTGGGTTPATVTRTAPVAASSVGGGTTTAAPTGGTSIVTTTAGNAGTYLVEFTGGFGGVAEATQLDNIAIKVNSTFKTIIPLANVANTQTVPLHAYFVLAAGDTVTAYVVNNASANSIYKAYVCITQLA